MRTIFQKKIFNEASIKIDKIYYSYQVFQLNNDQIHFHPEPSDHILSKPTYLFQGIALTNMMMLPYFLTRRKLPSKRPQIPDQRYDIFLYSYKEKINFFALILLRNLFISYLFMILYFQAPLLCFFRGNTEFREADIVTILGALQVLYVPLEMREDVPERAVKGGLISENI